MNIQKCISPVLILFLFSNIIFSNRNQVTMDKIAESYVKLVLKIGLYDDGYVDAYYGPDEWKPSALTPAQKNKFPHDAFLKEADDILNSLKTISVSGLNESERLRYMYLKDQMAAVRARVEILNGLKLSFDDESKALYDAIAPAHSNEYFANIIASLDSILPGNGTMAERLEKFKEGFIIPRDRVDTVFKAAINECRRRTLEHIKLPDNENFSVEYVTGVPWGAYNWYKGNAFSLIQVNTELPIYIDRAIDLACHEGYPGHHVYNALLEQHLVRERGWVEYTIYPLYSPQSLIAEGSANYGIDMAFPGKERIEFEKNVLFPLAGLDASLAEKYYAVLELTSKLNYAMNEAARQYINGQLTKEGVIDWLIKYSLSTPERAERSFRFIEHYRSYVINYNLGQDIVKNYIEKNGGNESSGKRWEAFYHLISTPQTPSGLQ